MAFTLSASGSRQVLCVVDGGGDTGGAPCSNATAHTTIESAVTAADAGDELRIAAGSYGSTTYDKSLVIKGGYAGGRGGYEARRQRERLGSHGTHAFNDGVNVTAGEFFTLGIDGGLALGGPGTPHQHRQRQPGRRRFGVNRQRHQQRQFR